MSALGTLGAVVLGAGDEFEISLDQSTGNTLTFSQLAVGVTLSPAGVSSFSMSQLASCTVVRVGEASNTLTLSQSAYRVQEGSASNTLDFTDEATFIKYKIVSATNTFVPAQTLTVEGVFNRSIFQTVLFINQAIANINRLVSVSNTLTLTSMATGYGAKAAKNELTFSDLAEAFIAKKATNFLEFTQSTALNLVLSRALFSSFEPLGKAVAGPNTFHRSLTNPFSPFHTAVGYAVKGAESEITFTQTLTGYAAKKAANNFPVVDHASYNAVFNVRGIPSQCKLNLTHTATVKLVKFVTASSTIAFEQLATKKHVLFAVASNTLNLSQDVIPGERIYADAENTLVLDQEATKQKVAYPTAFSVFAPVQTLNRTVTFNRAASNTLVFLPYHQQFANIGGVTYLSVPNAIGVLVEPYVILQGLNHTVVMPRPEFDDSEAFGGSMVILRSKTNVRRVYKKDTNKATLNYTFVIQRAKRDELKAFIRIYNSIPFYLENHKGERWFVTFKSNPFTFTEEALWQDCGRFTINLEFEGVRLS